MKDYFNILGVAENASPEEIKKAYKKLAMTHHPDRGGEQSKFQEIQEAYSVLSDPQKRAEWQHGARHPGGNPFGQAGFDFNFGPGADFNDIFSNFANGGMFSQFRPQAKNRDLRVLMEVTLESTLEKHTQHINVQHGSGGSTTVTVEIPRGVMPGMQMRCVGHGDKSRTDLPPGDLFVEFRIRPHPDFEPMGADLKKRTELNCIDAMLGTKIQVTGLDGKKFEVIIPPGTQHGTKFRINSQGLWVLNQPNRGDLHIEIAIHVPKSLTPDQLQKLQITT